MGDDSVVEGQEEGTADLLVKDGDGNANILPIELVSSVLVIKPSTDKTSCLPIELVSSVPRRQGQSRTKFGHRSDQI